MRFEQIPALILLRQRSRRLLRLFAVLRRRVLADSKHSVHPNMLRNAIQHIPLLSLQSKSRNQSQFSCPAKSIYKAFTLLNIVSCYPAGQIQISIVLNQEINNIVFAPRCCPHQSGVAKLNDTQLVLIH